MHGGGWFNSIAFPIYSDYVHVGCIPPSLIPNIAIPLYPNISNYQRTQNEHILVICFLAIAGLMYMTIVYQTYFMGISPFKYWQMDVKGGSFVSPKSNYLVSVTSFTNTPRHHLMITSLTLQIIIKNHWYMSLLVTNNWPIHIFIHLFVFDILKGPFHDHLSLTKTTKRFARQSIPKDMLQNIQPLVRILVLSDLDQDHGPMDFL